MKRIVQILSVAVALSAVGVGVGVGWQRQQRRIVSDTISHQAPELGPGAHLLLPDLKAAQVTVPDRPHEPAEAHAEDRFQRITRMRTFEVYTNSRGFRGPELKEPKEGFRIVCLGDSVTFGWVVPYEQSYPALLARELGVEVVDTGVPAMKPYSIAAFAERELAGLEADLVLFTRRPDQNAPDPYSDFEAALRKIQRAAGRAKVAVVLPPISTFDAKGVIDQPVEAQRLRKPAGDTPVLELTDAFRPALPRPGVVMEQLGGRQQVYRLPGKELLVDAAAPNHGLAPEIVALFEEDHSVAEPLFFDGGHPDQPGFEVFVAALVPWLRAEGLVPQGS